MFNFFESLKKEFSLPKNFFGNFNIVLISNKFLYVEGHKGLLKLSTENITFKVKGAVIIVQGTELYIKELTANTIVVGGKINNFEVI